MSLKIELHISEDNRVLLNYGKNDRKISAEVKGEKLLFHGKEISIGEYVEYVRAMAAVKAKRQ